MSFDPRRHYQDEAVARDYDRERFGSMAGRIFQVAQFHALERALRDVAPGATVLDAPCGTGRIAGALVARGFRVTGVDLSHEMLCVTRRRLPAVNGHLRLHRADICALPFPDGAFDVVLSMRFLPHFGPESRRPMLAELARVSRRWVVMSFSVSNPWHRGRRILKSWLRHSLPTRHPVTGAELQEDLRAAGLAERSRHWTLPIASEELLVVCRTVR